jgi:hypothetical protein
LCRLSVNDSEVITFGSGLFQSGGNLVEFAFAGSVGSSTDQPAGLCITGCGRKVKGTGEQIVTEKHTGFRIPATMDRGDMTPQVRIIDDVVMNQRSCMDHFDNSSQTLGFRHVFGFRTADASRQKCQNWTNLFSLKPADMLSHVLHEHAGTAELILQQLPDSFQIGAQQILDLLLQIVFGDFRNLHVALSFVGIGRVKSMKIRKNSVSSSQKKHANFKFSNCLTESNPHDH